MNDYHKTEKMTAGNDALIRVAVTDDHQMVLEGLEKVLSTMNGVAFAGSYNQAASLLEGLVHHTPDVLLLDLQMPGLSGPELVKLLLRDYPAMRILILSGIDAHYYIQEMIQQGCSGYLLKSTTDRDLLATAIDSVYKGELFLDPSVRDELFREMLQAKRKKKELYPRLTEREKEILQLILQEYGNQEIADKLFISLRTVENHRYHLLQKLDAKNTVGLVKIAMQMGLGK